jgi:hypothetical protein
LDFFSFNYNYAITIPRELRASFNLIVDIPPEVGKLKRLRKLVLNGNRIKKLPNEVGRLEMLEELIVSENALEEMPGSIATMAMLRVLKLQNNDLKSIPFGLVDVVTLEELDFSGNPHLKMVPKLWQGDTDSVLFVCKIHRGRLTVFHIHSCTSPHSVYLLYASAVK